MLLISSCLSLAAFSCNRQPDMYQCVLIKNDDAGTKLDAAKFYFYCKNLKTGEHIEQSVLEDTCLRDKTRECKFFGTDQDEYERGKAFYESQCKGNSK